MSSDKEALESCILYRVFLFSIMPIQACKLERASMHGGAWMPLKARFKPAAVDIGSDLAWA